MAVKPGHKTTEFLLTLLVLVADAIAAFTSNLSPHWAAIGAAVTSGLYAISRGLAKKPVAP